MSFILKFPNQDQDCYYVRYSPIKGPIFTFIPTEAYQFPTREHAQNVKNGDERFGNAVIEERFNATNI
jgi:hypothetical protein